MNKFTILLLFFFSCLSLQTEAQNYIGFQFNYMQPLNDYENNLDAHPKGFGLSYMFKPEIFKKFYIGAQFGVSMYARDSYMQTVAIDENEILDIEIEEEDCFFAYNVLGRYYLLEDKLINPYLEGRIGGLSFFSTKMTDEDYDKYYENSTSFYGTAFQLGTGGGLAIHVNDNLWVDLNVLYNRGSRTKYRNIASSDAEYRLNPELGKFESYTNNFNYALGVQFGF